MALFDPIRDYFHRRAAKNLNDAAARVKLVNRRQESHPGNFVFPGTDYVDGIEVAGQQVGYVDYGINPLRDRVYINMIEIEPAHQGKGIGLSVLWRLWMSNRVPIVPIHQYGASNGFWSKARKRFSVAGVVIETQLRSHELDEAMQRWQHLVPEPEHKRLQRELMASEEWPAIKARWEAEHGACLND